MSEPADLKQALDALLGPAGPSRLRRLLRRARPLRRARARRRATPTPRCPAWRPSGGLPRLPRGPREPARARRRRRRPGQPRDAARLAAPAHLRRGGLRPRGAALPPARARACGCRWPCLARRRRTVSAIVEASGRPGRAPAAGRPGAGDRLGQRRRHRAVAAEAGRGAPALVVPPELGWRPGKGEALGRAWPSPRATWSCGSTPTWTPSDPDFVPGLLGPLLHLPAVGM